VTKNQRNHHLMQTILYSALNRDENSIQMARDLQMMTYSECCIKERISFWEELYLEKISEFQNYCAEDISNDQDALLDKWYDMVVEDQIGLILGEYGSPPLQSCTCKCVVNIA